MDAPEEDLDVKLQKISGDLVADFDRSLGVLLRKPDGSMRSRVRSRETYRLLSSLLGPFQELPQLLDPHLPKWLPLLAESYLEYQLARRHSSKALSLRNSLLMPLPMAICAILYTFCKIRGEKVIVRFLNVEPKYLELLLSALESAERVAQAESSGSAYAVRWTWEERYIVLLWLSHLMLAPFDLATISSATADEDEVPAIPGFRWPGDLPSTTTRILPMAIKYLESPGKERDAAKALLVRMSMRKDMQQLGLLDALVQWALFVLRPKADDPTQPPYRYIGVLSFLAGILASSADTSDMDKHLVRIFRIVHATASDDDPASKAISTSALARKTAIKVIRSIAVLVLRNPQQDMAGTELVETTIGYLLESLADNDTPVRLAASKALSIITLKLDAEMATQVVDAVLDSLNTNVLSVKRPDLSTTKDLSAVDPLEWHGLMLTLSHLLYRRSPPAKNLSSIIHALLMGLSFEQRSASGISIGTNVRDAACFGIWALARRYTTSELLAVPAAGVPITKTSNTDASILQILATDLVVAACLDPAGNIRRGSAAALQELIGRHPDTVEQGIWVVQAVDYHAVARRSRAIQDVSLSATRLSGQYGEAILDALLGWRGIGYSDAPARRAAGTSYGQVTAELALASEDPVQQLSASVQLILDRINILQAREADERHGLLLSFAAVLDSLPATVRAKSYSGKPPPGTTLNAFLGRSIKGLQAILHDCTTKTYRRPELIAEAAGRLIISSFPLLQAAVLSSKAPVLDPLSLLPGPALISKIDAEEFASTLSHLGRATGPKHQALVELIALIKAAVGEWLGRTEPEVIAAVSEAGLILLIFSEPREREEAIRGWANSVRHRPSSRLGTVGGYFAVLTMSYPIISTLNLPDDEAGLLSDTLLTRWASDKDIDTRVSILQSLTQSELLRQNATVFMGLIADGLDDYTTNARGDVGSHVRLEAIRATKSLWEAVDTASPEDESLQAVISQLFLRILRLAAEKLDRVRVEAQGTLKLALNANYSTKLSRSTFSSKPYFRFLLELLFRDWLHPRISATAKADPAAWMEALMAGFVSSADTGNEDLVVASRAALCDFCEAAPAYRAAVRAALVRCLQTHHARANDRVVVPTLEIVAFLFRADLFARAGDPDDVVDYRRLCLLVQKAGYKTGNVRKIEACIKVYGAIAALGSKEDEDKSANQTQQQSSGQDAAQEARRRLGALLFHPWPRIRSLVVDELWGLLSLLSLSSPPSVPPPDTPPQGGAGAAADRLLGVDWGKADKESVRTLVEALNLA